jgi:DNA ligase-1
MSHDKEPVFTYYVFDVHDHPGGYEERCAELIRRVRAHNLGFITVLQSAEVKSEAELLAYEVEMIHLGYEGVIVRKPDAPYKYGRSTVNEAYLLKMKSFEDSEAEIIGFSEEQENGNDAQTNELGRTKRSTAKAGLSGKQTLGAFQVRDKVSGVEFSVGTGLTAAERQRYWDGRDSLVGALIKYKFFPVGVKVAPRHPVFLGFRDKSDL